jgi:peptidyl-prolyl cis-trans isomerase D
LSMFDLVRNNKKFIQLVLALIMLPFALWGVDSYVRTSSSDGIATVGGTPIALGEFQQALREQQDRLRPQLGNVSQDVLDSPEVRRGVLEELINQRLLALHASQSNLRVSDEALVRFITSVPSLQENGKFSRERYQALVAAQGMSVELFESKVKHDLLMQQAMIPIGNAAISGRIPTDSWLAAQLEERGVSEVLMKADQFAADSKPDAAAIKRFYDENRKRFEKPEQVRVEFLVLNQNKLVENAKPSEEEVKAWYKSNETRYKQAEQRQASHILIRADKSASDADVKAAQAKAEQILAQLKASPTDFAKLAKQHSQDPGSAEKGGDLGYFGRGMMVKAFEDSVFSLKENQVSDVVRSDFGFHLIKLTGVRSEQVRPLASVREEILAELKRQGGAKLYAESAEGFANIVYEQSDSLKPAADKYGLSVQTSEWIAKGGQGVAPFTNPKLLQTIFGDDAVKNKRNTESVDVGGNTLVSARVIDYRPAALEPLESVSGMIEKVLTRESAIAQAGTAGQAQLDKLAKGEKVNLAWSTVRSISRMHAPNLSAEARNAIFSAATKKLPAYVGAKAPGGFALYRIDTVKPFDSTGGGDVANRSQALRQHYGQVIAQEDLVGWLAALRQRYSVTINTAALERK